MHELLDLSGFDEPEPPEPPPPNKWANRMSWRPSGNPRLHPDEEAALAANQPGGEVPIRQGPGKPGIGMGPKRAAWRPGDEPAVPSRFRWQPGGGQSARSGVGPAKLEPMAGEGDVQQLIQALRAEEAKPPHQQNAATIARLKAEITELQSTMESRWVTRQADRLLEAADQ